MRRFAVIRYSRSAVRKCQAANHKTDALTGFQKIVKWCRNADEADIEMLVALLRDERGNPDSALGIAEVSPLTA